MMLFFFFNNTWTTEFYALSLHDALPIYHNGRIKLAKDLVVAAKETGADAVKFQTFKTEKLDRKSTRLNSSHVENSYAAFCLKKKNLALKNADYPSNLHLYFHLNTRRNLS